jgi:uncharacterized protein
VIIRHAKERVQEALTDTPVVAIVGPRQCGKSTLAREFESGRRYLTLDDPNDLEFAKTNPLGFLKTHGPSLIIDEIQRAPELFLPLKMMVDENRKPGSYLLTGSANVLLLPKIADSLAGRMEVIDLLPLSQREIAERDGDWIQSLFSEYWQTSEYPDSFESRIIRGGFPEIVQRNPRRRDAWFESYIRTLLDRDVRDIANIDGLVFLPKLLRLLAIKAGEPLNISTLSRETGIAHTTLTRYLDLLKALYLTHDVRAWSSDLAVRLAKSPKSYLVDSGLACYLCGANELRIKSDATLRRSLVETYLASELKKLVLQSSTGADLYHLRTVKNREVSFLIESRNGTVIAFDIEDAPSVSENSIQKMEYVKEIVGDSFHLGLILHTGIEQRPLREKIWAVPLNCF